MKRFWPVLVLMALAACEPVIVAGPAPAPVPRVESGPVLSGAQAAQNFIAVVDRMEPIIENECRALRRASNCDFLIVVDDRPGLPPNAFQTLDERGRPVIGFTLSLIADARNADEVAFVLGHEAAHHIRGHLPRVQQTAAAGAMILGTLASLGGADVSGVQAARDLGATVGARSYSKDYELQADELGTVLAWRAGYDPVRGAAFFSRLPDPGNSFLGSHPPNADRWRVVNNTVARLERR